MTGLGEYTTEELEAELELRKQELPSGWLGALPRYGTRLTSKGER